ncbi:MATE family efflux transporter [Paenibacillus illinoisensis]|uniref:MATE family efflux transporter n=1 Tax=Paenibacillus illinoisensis TaxID=59845 RepID=UPI0027D9ABC2|nr:MATE family efflux transporter [Paenibacillus illinoisensis]
MYTLIDRAFVGHIPGEGPSALIAIGLSMPMISVITAISAYIAFGSLANISQSLGKHEPHKASRFVGNAISLSIVIGLAFTIIFFIFKPQIFHFLSVSNGIYPYIDQFLFILMGGAFVSILGFVLPILVRANGGPLYSSMVILAGCLLNILLDWLFLFVFHLGIGGAAIATIISHAVTVILSIFHFVQGNSIIKLEKNNFALNFNIIHSISLIGLVPLTNNLSIGIAQIIMNFSLSHNGGEIYVGALATIVSIISLIMMRIFGLNQGIMPILGYKFAQKSYKRVFQTLYHSVGYGLIFLTLGTVFI